MGPGEGCIAVKKSDLSGAERHLARIRAPAMLGHMTLAGGGLRSASCVAEGEARVLVLSRDRFDSLMRDVGDAGDIFRRVLIAGMSRQLAGGNAELRQLLLPAFEDCDTEAIDRELLTAQATFDGWVG